MSPENERCPGQGASLRLPASTFAGQRVNRSAQRGPTQLRSAGLRASESDSAGRPFHHLIRDGGAL